MDFGVSYTPEQQAFRAAARAWLAVANPMLSPRRSAGNSLTSMAGDTANKLPVPKAGRARNPTTDPRLGDKALQIMATR